MKIAQKIKEQNSIKKVDLTIKIDERLYENAQKIAQKFNIDVLEYIAAIVEESEIKDFGKIRKKRTQSKQKDSIEGQS